MDVKVQLTQTSECTTGGMDHHGLVAATCRELGIAEKITSRIGSKDPRRKVQLDLATEAMIINGLGFKNRRLYQRSLEMHRLTKMEIIINSRN